MTSSSSHLVSATSAARNTSVAAPPSELQHPLGPKLHRALRCLYTGEPDQVALGASELASVVEDEAEVMLHRSHPINTTHKGLGRWLARWLSALAEDAPASAVLAIDALAAVEFTDESTRTVLFTRLLSRVVVTADLENQAAVVTAVRAADTWGQLLAGGSWLVPEVVEAQVRLAVEWLCFDPSGRRRFVGNLFLQQAGTLRAAASVLPRLDTILRGVWCALRDDHSPTRVTTALTLRMALDLGTNPQFRHAITSGPAASEAALWADTLGAIRSLVAVPQRETCHGGLLGFHAALHVAVERGGAADYHHIDPADMDALWAAVLERLRDTATSSMPHDVFVALTDLLPLMARYDRDAFVARCIAHVSQASTQVFRGASSTAAERAQMFVVVGELGTVLSDYIPYFVDRLVRSAELNLLPNPKLQRDRCDEAATTLARLAQADPATMRPYMLPLMDPLFAGRVTVNFARDVRTLCDVYPELQSLCLDRVVGVVRQRLGSATGSASSPATAPVGPPATAQALASIPQPSSSGLAAPSSQHLGHSSVAVPAGTTSSGGPSPPAAAGTGAASGTAAGPLAASSPANAPAVANGGVGSAQGSVTASAPPQAAEIAELLDALCALDFTGYSVLDVLVTRVLPQLSNSSSVVRSSAARCCAALAFSGCTGWRCPCGIDADGAFEHEGREHVQAILSVQAQLLNVAVADPDSDVRLLALQLLGREFDATLASQEACRTLFPALNDKPAIRHCAMRLLGRLSRRNPGCVFPILRRTIIQCSTELHLLDHVRRQEQAATLLGTLVDAAPALVAPYAPALLQGMATKLSADPPAPAIVITAVLATVTRLVLHVPEASLDAVRALTPIVVSHVLDDGPQGRRVEALRALTSIVRATHDVNLYQRHPQLLRHVTGMLHGGRKEGWGTRQDVLAFLGAIGAVDPGRVKAAHDAATAAGDDAEGDGEAGQSAAMAQLAFGRGLDDEALARYAIQTALAVVSQSSVDDECCKHASRAICRILETRKLPLRASVATLRRVVPEVLKQIPQRPKIREGLFCDLSDTAEFVAQHVRAFLQAIYPVAAQYLSDPDAAVVRAVVRLLMELRRHLNEELAPFIPHLLPLMVRVADERQNEPTVVVSILGAFQSFGSLLAGHLHVVLPSVIDIAVDSTADLEARTCAIRSVRVLAAALPALADHASRVIHALCRVMSDPPTTARADHRTLAKMLASEAYEALRALMILLGPRYARYDHSVRHVMARHYAEAPHRYSEFLSFSATVSAADRPVGHHPHIDAPPQSSAFRPSRTDRDGDDSAVAAPDPRFTTAIDHLSRVSSVGEDEWGSWLRQLCKALLADCQATPLRVCVDLARVHEPSARALFHPTFAACFVRMPANMTRVVVARLGQVLESPRTPKEVVQDLLNLVEYLERIEDMTLRGRLHRDRARRGAGHGLGAFTADADDTVWCLGGLFELSTLVEQSERCNLFAKALHYAELQFTQLTRLPLRAIAAGRPVKLPEGRWEALLNICEKTIGLYSRLGAQESANGVLDFVQRNYGALTGARGEFRVANADMYEKLQWWSEAFRVYQRIYRQTNQAPALAGMLRSLDALGDFQGVHDMWRAALRHRHRLPKREIPALAQYGARAAWLLQRWDDLSEATSLMSSDGYDLTTQHFYRAMVAMRRGDVDSTRASIADCRRSLDRDLSAVMAESYDRAYPLLIGLHQLSELEELSALGTCAAMSLPRLSALWRQRLDALATSAVEWQGTLVNHSMALNPEDDLEPWLRFITICVRGQRYRMAEAILQRLLRSKDVAAGIVMTHPAVQQPKTTIVAPTPPAASPTVSESIASPPPPPPAESPTGPSVASAAASQKQQPPHRQPAAVAIAAAQFLYDVGRSQQATESLTAYSQILNNEVMLEASAAAVVPEAVDESSPLAGIARQTWGMSRHLSDLAGQSTPGPQPFVAALSGGSSAFPCPSVSTARRELSRALVKLADWKIADTTEFWRKPEELQEILATIDDAREHDPHHIGAWRQWAAVSKACATTTSRATPLSKTELERFLLNAAEGYLRCIESSELLQQDVLSLLSVWFAYGGAFPAVAARVTDAIQLVPNDAWLRVVPQIMARVHTHEEAITRGVRKLLLSIAGNHPQALLFPLHVCVYATATGSDVLKRRDGAIDVLNEVANVHGDRGARMVRDAALVSEELIACAIISIEKWYDVIEEAWRAFLQHPTLKGDVRVMHGFFAPLVALLDVPRNEADRRFVSTYGDSLRAMFDHVQAAVNRVEAGQWTATTAEESHEDPDVKAAWEILTRVHENLEAECRGIQALTIALVSPRLEESCAGDEPLAVAVPGHYRTASRSPYIARFDSDLKVMGSKNRPRKAAIIGDDGVRYKHMIKGQEDMRLDERVMQLLGLVNALFEAHIRTANKRMAATTYAVTPLNDNVGLVGWVDGCDTLHDVIRKYRAAVDIPASREYKLIDFESGGSPERLSLMQKMEVFEFAIDDADGAEIARSMWVSSASAEAWLEARTTFLRTLGSMSMVGFVLGLGDRHPSNLMLGRSGAVVHIDFGDCFEVAMLRHNIPERVPFRLTRMLEKAMEPAGISGLFRTTCEAVMSVLRSERDNLMSMLEAFVHDPLITWRIVAADEAAAASTSVVGQGSMGTGPSGNAAAVVPASLAATSLAARALNPDRNGDMAVGSMSRAVPSSARFPAPMPENFVPSSFAAQGAATSVLLQSVRAPQQLDGPPVAEHTRRARQLVDRVRDKLMGQEDPRIPPSIEERVPRPQAPVPSQVDRLIRQATSHENLCQAWKGWCAFW